jgi:hypothetical protein
MTEIPPILVSVSALFASIIFFIFNNNKFDIRIMSIPFFLQFIIYGIFCFDFGMSLYDKQFIARSNTILIALALSIVLIASGRKDKNGK